MPADAGRRCAGCSTRSRGLFASNACRTASCFLPGRAATATGDSAGSADPRVGELRRWSKLEQSTVQPPAPEPVHQTVCRIAPSCTCVFMQDLDGTLIASEELNAPASVFLWNPPAHARQPDYEAMGRRVWLRPGVREFLASVRPHFEIVLFTAATQVCRTRRVPAHLGAARSIHSCGCSKMKHA